MGQIIITVEMALKLETKSIHVTPGWKLCRTCHKELVAENVKTLMEKEQEEPECEQSTEAIYLTLYITLGFPYMRNVAFKQQILKTMWARATMLILVLYLN